MNRPWPPAEAAAAALAEAIAARADEIEAARRLPADLAASLAGDGLMHLFLPACLGGPETAPAAGLAAIGRLAQADGATGWCAMIASTSSLVAAYLPGAEAQAIFARGAVPPIVGGVYAPMGRAVPNEEGTGFRLSGRWGWASNSANCRWLLAGAVVDGHRPSDPGARPDMRLFLLPAAGAQLIDTWHAMGLCGTGSGDFAVADLEVPRERSLRLAGGRPVVSTPLYRFPIFGLLALGVACVALGIARGALDDLAALVVGKRPAGSSRTLAERSHVQGEMAGIEGCLRAASALVEDAVAKAWAVAGAQPDAASGAPVLPQPQRAALRLAAVHAVRTAVEVVSRAYDLAGGSAVYRSHPLQRRLRDVQTAAQHAMVGRPVLEGVGRSLLGQAMDDTEL